MQHNVLLFPCCYVRRNRYTNSFFDYIISDLALEQADLPLSDIHALRHKAVAINGPARPYVRRSDQVVARVLGRDKKVQDVIYAVE